MLRQFLVSALCAVSILSFVSPLAVRAQELSLTDQVASLIAAQRADTANLVMLYRDLGAHLMGQPEHDVAVLEAAIEIIGRDGEEATETIETLRAAVETRGVGAEPISILARQLTAVLMEAQQELPAAVRQDLLDLERRISEIGEDRPISFALTLARRLDAAITAAHPAPSIAVTGGALDPDGVAQALLPAVAPLRATILRLEEPFFDVALANRVSDLKAILPENGAGPPLSSSNLTLLADLVVRIDALRGEQRTRGMHVVSARFGRIANPSTRESCDVTHILRGACQGSMTCPISVSQIETACGGSTFAPSAVGEARGLVVRYACLAGRRADWNATLASQSITFSGQTLHQVFRTDGAQIACER